MRNLRSPQAECHGLKIIIKFKLTHVLATVTSLSLSLHIYMYESEAVKLAQSCLTLCDSMDCSLPRSSVRGILQARILEWVAISFSRRSSQPRDRTRVSRIAGRLFTTSLTVQCMQLEFPRILSRIRTTIMFCFWKKSGSSK